MNDNGLRADAVFEGGGVKGIGLVGAVAVAEEAGYRWMNLAGTSAGAIVASLIAAGYTAEELAGIMSDLDYRNFKDTSWIGRLPLAGPLGGLLFKKGMYRGGFFINWIGGLLEKKGVVTFKDLIVEEFSDDPKYRYRLNVIVSDITRGRLLVLPQDIEYYGITPDDLNVSLAVRMSMSIPFFYEPVKLKNVRTNETSFLVDGGLLSNFPVWLFDTQSGIPEWPTFGFKLVEPEEGEPHDIGGPVSLLTAPFGTMMEAHDARYIKEENFVRTVPIPTLGVKTTEFDITRERSDALYESGRKAGKAFLEKWDFQQYKNRYREQQVKGRTARMWDAV